MLIFLVKSKKQLVIIIENKSHEKHFVQITKLTFLGSRAIEKGTDDYKKSQVQILNLFLNLFTLRIIDKS